MQAIPRHPDKTFEWMH